MASFFIYSFAVICCTALLAALKKSGHFFKGLFMSALQGVTALLAVNAVGQMIALSVPLSPLTLISSVFFGTPAVILHLIASVILKI